MKLTFDDCVRLIWIYFAIKTGLPILGKVVYDVLNMIILGEKSEFHKYTRDKEVICELNATIQDLRQQIEDEKAKNEVKAKRIGFVSNNLENS